MTSRRSSIRMLPVFLGLVLVGSGTVARTAAQAQAPAASAVASPEKFFGFQMGADRKLANWDKLHEYYQLLAKSSNKLRLVELGKSSEGRPYIALFISSAANLAKLDQFKQMNARLADPRGLSEADAKKLVAEARAVVIQSFALHSSEVAASQAAAEFVYDSITRTDSEAQAMLDNVISIVAPSINPDGTQMIADWYMKYVGTPHEASGLPWLYQKYAGHDNNRDGFALNLPESQHLGKLMYRDWIPQAYVDHHQMGSGNARLYIPPYAEPIRPDGDPLVWREMSWWGAHMGNRLEAAGKTGVIGSAIYSGWGHMGFHWITPFHNIAGMLTESASARLATPMFLHPDQLRGGPRGLPQYQSQVTMPSLWQGGWWRVRDIVEQQKIAAWATVDLAAQEPRDRAVEHVSEGHASDGAGRERTSQGLRDCGRAARSADGQEVRQHAAQLGRRSAPIQDSVLRRRSRVWTRILRGVDGATQAGAGALDARADVLPGQLLHPR